VHPQIRGKTHNKKGLRRNITDVKHLGSEECSSRRKEATPVNGRVKWWGGWLGMGVASLLFPSAMVLIASLLYKESFGQVDPWDPWPERSMDVLLLFDGIWLGAFLYRSRMSNVAFAIGYCYAGIEFILTLVVWLFAGLAVTGQYF
jgi:hypothetical protein